MRAMSNERGWYYVVEPDGGRHAPPARRLATPDGRILTVRHHGHPGRVEVLDGSRTLPVATLLRAARAVGAVVPHPVRVHLGAGPARVERDVHLDGAALADAPSPWPVEEAVAALIAASPPAARPAATGLPAAPVRRALFFESLMNAEMPHNDAELSQGVLHMVSALRGTGTEVVFANVKMAITGTDRPVHGLDQLAAALVRPVGLVCITLLEGYWPGVVSLVRTLRELGCRAHVALGGVMPTLTPEHVAAHFPDATFICRGAGEEFVPRLARIVGDGDIDTPLTDAQVTALLELRGLIAVDRAGGRLVSAASDHVVQVEELDRVDLDLSRVEPRHLATGVELATSRGCLHRCTFCSIIGRESYQARSSGGVIALLGKYDAHFSALFGEGPRDARGRNTAAPRNAYRVHFSDDDFACDRARALAFFRALRATPFRLSSCQVSIADLCVREDGRLLPAPDRELLDAITPDCFDDHGAALATRDFVADHRTRRWSSYLQIGVESFSDRELARLGKGYQRAHVRAIVSDLAARGLHHDAYFILSNADTSADDLLDVLDEVVRLKLAHPVYFHVRFPVVARLVSYFPSASYRRRLRQGQDSACVRRDTVAVPNHPEVDYPFVEHDAPRDPLVSAAVDAAFFTDEHHYAGSYARLRDVFVARWKATGDPEAEHLARVVDDRGRRRLFELLDEARREARSIVTGREAHLRRIAETTLGPVDSWLPSFSRHCQEGGARLVVIPTWQCELRCGYCYIPKQDGRVMPAATLERAVGLLLSSERPRLTLQFFGGEALLEWERVQHGIRYAAAEAARRGKHLDFVLSSNGWSLDEEKLAWLADYPVKLELSLDGDPDTQRLSRPARRPGEDSYQSGIAPRAAAIVASGLAHDVIMVVHPNHVHRLAHNFLHIADLGFRRVQINFALGKAWTVAQRQTFAAQLFELAGALRGRPEITFVNAENAPGRIRLNAEITVDWDGAVYGGNAFLHETEHKPRFRLGHLDDLAAFDRYWLDAPGNDDLVTWSYPAAVTDNNLKVGAVLHSFVTWYRAGASA